jgi:glutamate racemase
LDRNLPIGIFDSGVGGLTVYRALHTRLPSERYVYLGDTARVPYGTKSLSTVERYAIENARFLEARGVKLLVVACNTASALALPAVRRGVSVPVVGMIEPGARAAVGVGSARGRVGVIATESTVKSGAYRRAIEEIAPGVEVTERACPLFVALAEEGWAETDVARAVAEEYLRELREREVGALVLGCTHYPILRRVIQETLGAGVRLIDSGEAAAEAVEDLIEREGLRRTATQELRDLRESGARERFLCDDLDHFYVTDAAERFAHVAERFLGSAPRRLEAVEVWGHDELHTR